MEKDIDEIYTFVSFPSQETLRMICVKLAIYTETKRVAIESAQTSSIFFGWILDSSLSLYRWGFISIEKTTKRTQVVYNVARMWIVKLNNSLRTINGLCECVGNLLNIYTINDSRFC